MSESHSEKSFFSTMQNGSDTAARQDWDSYFDNSLHLAKRKIGTVSLRDADREDIVLFAIHSFLRYAKNQSDQKFADRDELWALLVTITARKISTQRKCHFAQNRGSDNLRGESVFLNRDEVSHNYKIDQIVGQSPTPEFTAEVAETCQNLLDEEDCDALRQVALLRLKGYNNAEIATQMGLTQRSIKRKVALTRKQWSPELDA